MVSLHRSLRASQVVLVVKNPPANAENVKRHLFNPWVGKMPWRTKWQSTPVFLPGESQGQRSLVGYSPWGHKESDRTEVTEHAYTPQVSVPHADCRSKLDPILQPAHLLSALGSPGHRQPHGRSPGVLWQGDIPQWLRDLGCNQRAGGCTLLAAPADTRGSGEPHKPVSPKWLRPAEARCRTLTWLSPGVINLPETDGPFKAGSHSGCVHRSCKTPLHMWRCLWAQMMPLWGSFRVGANCYGKSKWPWASHWAPASSPGKQAGCCGGFCPCVQGTTWKPETKDHQPSSFNAWADFLVGWGGVVTRVEYDNLTFWRLNLWLGALG